MKAWEGGASGCTTFREDGKRFGVLNSSTQEEPEDVGTACYIDPSTGMRVCDE